MYKKLALLVLIGNSHVFCMTPIVKVLTQTLKGKNHQAEKMVSELHEVEEQIKLNPQEILQHLLSSTHETIITEKEQGPFTKHLQYLEKREHLLKTIIPQVWQLAPEEEQKISETQKQEIEERYFSLFKILDENYRSIDGCIQQISNILSQKKISSYDKQDLASLQDNLKFLKADIIKKEQNLQQLLEKPNHLEYLQKPKKLCLE